MSTKSKIISLLIPVLFFASCVVRPVVESYRDPDVDYTVLKTFSFVSAHTDKKGQTEEWSLEEKALFPIVRADLERRGFTYQGKIDDSDFIVTAMVANRYKSEYVPEKTIYPTSDYYIFRQDKDDDKEIRVIAPARMPYTYGGYREDYFLTYAELNFYDSKTKKKIWKGSGLCRMDTYDVHVVAPPLISAILDRFRTLPEGVK